MNMLPGNASRQQSSSGHHTRVEKHTRVERRRQRASTPSRRQLAAGGCGRGGIALTTITVSACERRRTTWDAFYQCPRTVHEEETKRTQLVQVGLTEVTCDNQSAGIKGHRERAQEDGTAAAEC